MKQGAEWLERPKVTCSIPETAGVVSPNRTVKLCPALCFWIRASVKYQKNMNVVWSIMTSLSFSFWYCRMISIIRSTITGMSALIQQSLRWSGALWHHCAIVHQWHHPSILQVHSVILFFLCFSCVFIRLLVVISLRLPGGLLQDLLIMLWNVSRTPFRTYWSSALMVSPSGSAPYPTTGGGRWDEAQSNRECWLLSDVCGDKIQNKGEEKHPTSSVWSIWGSKCYGMCYVI